MKSLDDFLTMPLNELMYRAQKIRNEHQGDHFELCSILNAKAGKCSEDCKFCAQSSHNKSNIDVFSLLDVHTMVEKAQQAKNNGALHFGIVTSGNTLADNEIDSIAEAIHQITYNIKLDVCASLGALHEKQLSILKDAGLTRYHHNLETSPRYYVKIVSTHKFDERIKTIQIAKDIGLEVCSGGIIGIGEGWEDRMALATLLLELDVDAIPLNILVPIKGTPLESIPPLSVHDIMRTICMFRIILQNKTIKIAAGRETLKEFQSLGFMSGANGMLIGGYLTVKGRSVEEDLNLLREIKQLWKE